MTQISRRSRRPARCNLDGGEISTGDQAQIDKFARFLEQQGRQRPRGELPAKRESPVQGELAARDGWDFTATVLGVPYPEGSKIGVRGRGGQVYVKDASSKTKDWRGIIKDVCGSYPAANEPFDGSLEVDLVFTYEPPQKWDGVTAPTTKSTYDIDKLIRSAFDGMSDAGVWVDDARASKVTAEQLFVGMDGALAEPGMVISIRRRSHRK